MAKPVIMPKLGFTQESSQIIRWLKQAGEAVEAGDPILEVTTDKVDMEVEAPATGILDGIRFQAGETVPVTEVIAYIRSATEAPLSSGGVPPSEPSGRSQVPPPLPTGVTPPQPPAPPSPPPTAATAEATSVRATPVAANLAREKGVDLGKVHGTGPGGSVTKQDVQSYIATQAAPPPSDGKVRAAPAARRLAQELQIDLATVQGHGPRGRIQSDDVRAAQARPQPVSAPPEPAQPAGSAAEARPNVLRVIPLTGMRLTIARRMQKSAQEAPHITFDADVDVAAAEALRARAKSILPDDQSRISLTAIIAKACAWALKRHPIVNSRLEDQQILLMRDVNIGIAVALEEGLIVPVVPAVDRKGLAEIATDIAGVSDRARNGRLRAEDLANGTFTISNLGMFGIDRFTAIINPPETAILAVGRTTRRLVPDDEGRPVVRPVMTVTLSADHRVIDGAAAARFLSDVRVALEHPDLLAI